MRGVWRSDLRLGKLGHMSGVAGRSGGTRAGSGEKPSEARVLGLIGGRRGEGVELAPPVEIPCPDWLGAEAKAVWAELAEHAIKARTLVPSTVVAFTRLCKAVVRHAEMEAQIAKDGLTYLKVTVDGSGQQHDELKAHPLISRAGSLESSIKAWMKDFALHPFGKPVIEVKAKAVDPFAKFKAGA